MTQVDNTFDTLTDIEDWQDTAPERRPQEVAPVVQESRLSRFLQSLAASMALQKRPRLTADRQHVIMGSTEMLAQNYPHLYLRVMCG